MPTTPLTSPTGSHAPVVALPTRERRAHPAGRKRRRPTPRPGQPSAPGLAALLVRAAAEVAAGERPLRQLEPLVTPALARRLAADARRNSGSPSAQLRIRRVVAAPPTPSGAVEATVLLEREDRVTAVAVRLERHRGAWRATELTAPEAGYAPLLTASEPDPLSGRPDAFDEVLAEHGADTPPTLRLVGPTAVTRPRGTS